MLMPSSTCKNDSKIKEPIKIRRVMKFSCLELCAQWLVMYLMMSENKVCASYYHLTSTAVIGDSSSSMLSHDIILRK